MFTHLLSGLAAAGGASHLVFDRLALGIKDAAGGSSTRAADAGSARGSLRRAAWRDRTGHTAAGMHQRMGQLAIVGQKQRTLGVVVQAPDGKQAQTSALLGARFGRVQHLSGRRRDAAGDACSLSRSNTVARPSGSEAVVT